MTRPYVVAVGRSPVGQFGMAGRDLFSLAIEEAFAGLPSPRELVDALYVGSQSESYEHQIVYGSQFAEWAGLRHVPAQRVEGCAASGGLAFHEAVSDVAAGTHDAVLACGVETMSTGGTPVATDSLVAASERTLGQRSGITAPGVYAMLAQRYLHEHDRSEADLARIAVRNHRNARGNPIAQFDREFSLEDVLESPPVADPIKLLECAPVSDGSAAAIVASEAVAERLVGLENAIAVDGFAAVSDALAIAEHDLTRLEGVERAVESVYEQAGIGAGDVDLAEVHDAFSINEALSAEAAGFTPAGRGHEVALDPDERSAECTDVRVNTSGGLKARGHPVGATGIYQIVEAYERIVGVDRPDGPDRRIADADRALCLNEGGTADSITTAHLLSGVDA